jgi:hypothetical protein
MEEHKDDPAHRRPHPAHQAAPEGEREMRLAQLANRYCNAMENDVDPGDDLHRELRDLAYFIVSGGEGMPTAAPSPPPSSGSGSASLKDSDMRAPRWESGAARIAFQASRSGCMVVCSQCGFKRCPGANGHPCTGSNEPGQPGSNFE